MSSDWRRALDVYVAGRSRSLTTEEKRRIVAPTAGRSDPAPGRGAARPAEPTYGVSVPEKLDYYRNASTWRNRLSSGRTHGDAVADG